MTREIKFRARFKKISNSKECWQEILLSQNKITILENMSGYIQITDWLQSTGLKDKNQKMIFEGDIIKLSNHKSQIQTMEIIGVVSENFASWGVVIKKVNDWQKYKISPPEKNNYYYFLNLINSKVYETIGNKWENPELLKQ